MNCKHGREEIEGDTIEKETSPAFQKCLLSVYAIFGPYILFSAERFSATSSFSTARHLNSDSLTS